MFHSLNSNWIPEIWMWLKLASLQPFTVLKCLKLENWAVHIQPQLPFRTRIKLGFCLFFPQWVAQFLFGQSPVIPTASDSMKHRPCHETQKFSKFTSLLCQSGRGALSAINECDYTDVVINARLQACDCVVSYWGVHKIFKNRDTFSCRNYCDAVPNNGGGI